MLQYLSYNRYIYKCGKFSCRVVNCHNSTTKVSHGSAWVEIKVSLHFNCPYGSLARSVPKPLTGEAGKHL